MNIIGYEVVEVSQVPYQLPEWQPYGHPFRDDMGYIKQVMVQYEDQEPGLATKIEFLDQRLRQTEGKVSTLWNNRYSDG